MTPIKYSYKEMTFNPDGSLCIPKIKYEPPEKKLRKKKQFWDIWTADDIWFVYILPNDKLLDKVEEDHIRDYVSWGETKENAKREFEGGFSDIVETFADLRIVVAKTEKAAIEVAWKNFNKFKLGDTANRRDYKIRVYSAESVLGLYGERLKQQFVFNHSTREAEIPFETKQKLLRDVIYKAY